MDFGNHDKGNRLMVDWTAEDPDAAVKGQNSHICNAYESRIKKENVMFLPGFSSKQEKYDRGNKTAADHRKWKIEAHRHYRKRCMVYINERLQWEWTLVEHLWQNQRSEVVAILPRLRYGSWLHPAQSLVELVMFLNRILTKAEAHYWPSKLEVAAEVSIVKKIRVLIESSSKPTVIYTDHVESVAIGKQKTLTMSPIDKLNLRLVRASERLQRFQRTEPVS